MIVREIKTIAAGAIVGAAAGFYLSKDWKKGAIIGALASFIAPKVSGIGEGEQPAIDGWESVSKPGTNKGWD